MEINNKVMQKIYEHAIKEYPKECCGILLGNKGKEQIWEIYQAGNADLAGRQNMHFLIDPLELYRVEKKAEKENMEIVGFYHSHADYPEILSKEDQASMLPGLFYIIVSIAGGVRAGIKCYTKTEFRGEFCEIKMESNYEIKSNYGQRGES